MNTIIKINRNLWEATKEGLSFRSKGRCEAACIWAGQRKTDEWLVEEVIYIDDIAGTKRGLGYHSIPRSVIDTLFKLLHERKLQIIADIHTHPSSWVGLSVPDREHPIEYRVGLISIIYPHFAQGPLNLRGIGVHEYLGSSRWSNLKHYLGFSRWRTLSQREITKKIQIVGG